ncbi:Transposase DDE domain protein [Pseudovibrio sp. Ad26]|nr:Transposase DDE domain protein [Pseudovibrio sp. Ad26]
MRSIFGLMKLALPVPDCSTLSRRAGGLKLSPPKSKGARAPATLVIDSTGLKVFGADEWQKTKHGTKQKHRNWRKLHLGVDLESGEVLCCEPTEDNVGDPTVVSDMLDQVGGPVATFLGDGAYDGFPTRQEIEDRYEGVEIIIPTAQTAVPSLKAATAPTARDRDILLIEEHGSMGWQKQKGYGRRSPRDWNDNTYKHRCEAEHNEHDYFHEFDIDPGMGEFACLISSVCDEITSTGYAGNFVFIQADEFSQVIKELSTRLGNKGSWSLQAMDCMGQRYKHEHIECKDVEWAVY